MVALVQHNNWRHRWLFGLALSGAVISLSNMFSFPLAVGELGGAFVIAFLLAHLIIAVPVVMAELLIGRRGRHSVPHSLAHLSAETFCSQRWRYLGVVMVFTGAVVAAYYLAFSSWAMDFIWKAAQGELPTTESGLRFALAELVAEPHRLIALHTLVCLFTFVCLALPSQWGVQLPVAAMAAILLAGVTGLVVWAIQHGVWADGVDLLFDVPSGSFGMDTWIRAASLSFYSLGLGLGISLVLGAHMDVRLPIGTTALWVVLVDILWSLLFAGAVLGYGAHDLTGDALEFIYVQLPFQVMSETGSLAWPLLFFTLVLLSGLSTGLLLVKNGVMWLQERYTWTRPISALVALLFVWGMGIVVLLSVNVWQEVRIYGATILEWVSTIPANLLLPALSLLLVFFVGWVMPARHTIDELRPGLEHRFIMWRFSIRFVTTLALLMVLMAQVQATWQVSWWLQGLLLGTLVTLYVGWYRFRYWNWEST